jgi:hypothetical protein
MKKSILLPVLLLVAALLAACSTLGRTEPSTVPPQTSPSTSETEATAATTEPTEAPTQPFVSKAPLIAVALPVTTESLKSGDSTDIFNYTFQNISLIAQDPDVADLVIIDFLNRVDATRLTADRICSLAQSAYSGQSNWSAYLCMISYNPVRIDPGVLSLFGTQAGFYGSTHPETVYSAVNYDLVTGKALTLGDILTDSASPDQLMEYSLSILKSREKELYLYEDYPDTVKSHFASGAIQHCWFFTDEGLSFYFTPYEIAPYSVGVVNVTIPYDQLAGLLRDEYFPAEQDTSEGSLFAQPFTPDAFNSFTRFAELVQDDGAKQYLLYPEGSVRNVRIETGIWSASGSFYTPQHTIFAASGLSTGDALMLQAEVTEELPRLRISWQTDAGTETRFIALDSSGNIILKTP